MRTYVIPTLLLVFAMVTGACAGRQVRTRTVAAPPPAESTLLVASEAAPAPMPDVEPAPIVEAPAPSIDGDKPDSSIAAELASTDFDVQGSLDRDNDQANAEIAVEVRRMTEPATRTPSVSRRDGQLVGTLRIDRKRAADLRRPDQGFPAFDDGRQAVVGSLATASPALEQAPAAPAAPSILPAPQGAKADLNAGLAKDREARKETAAVSDSGRDAVAESHDMRSAYLFGTALAACIGILSGLLAAWSQRRRLRAISATPYDHYADGTILEQRIVRGVAVIVRVIEPELPAPRSEPEAEQKAKMDSIEQTWHAQGDALGDENDPQAGTPRNRRFDLTDAEDDAVQGAFEHTDPSPPPVPFSEPDTNVAPEPSSPHVQPESQDAQPTAAAPPKIISSSDDVSFVSGVADAPDPPPDESRSEPEHVGAKVIILFEDKSSKNDQAEQTAAPAITH
jgi:hypothetical protein